MDNPCIQNASSRFPNVQHAFTLSLKQLILQIAMSCCSVVVLHIYIIGVCLCLRKLAEIFLCREADCQTWAAGKQS